MKPPLILAIDDSPDILLALGLVLGQDYDLRVASDPEEGLELAMALLPELILLDVVMPEMDGFTLMKKLRRQQCLDNTPVIFLTSLIDQTDEARCLTAGAVDFIAKPFCSEVLLARLKSQLLLKQQADELRRIAMVDGLTAVANRRAFDERLTLEWSACRREKAPLALLMIDLDHFKQFNDNYGHQLGDRCLKSAAQTIGRQLKRPRDFVARYGGEEFACLLPRTGLDDAVKLADRVREQCQQHTTELLPVHSNFSVSIGVASAYPGAERASELLFAADTALYGAKKAGRNCVRGQPMERGQ